MLTSAIILVFISAILHVSWNILLQSTDDPLDISTKAIGIGILLMSPLVIAHWMLSHTQMISNQAILYGFLSGIAELGYFLFLSYCYNLGELSVVYPIARGAAPLISFFLGIFLLKEIMTAYQIIGVLLLLVGILFVRRSNKKFTKGVIPALFTGLFIAIYTIIDKIGLRYTDPIYFGELKYFFTAICLIAFIPVKRHLRIYNGIKIIKKTSLSKIALIGVCIISTYQLILFALTNAPVAVISPLRESASIFVTGWGIWKLKERNGIKFKIAGVILIFIGIISLVL